MVIQKKILGTPISEAKIKMKYALSEMNSSTDKMMFASCYPMMYMKKPKAGGHLKKMPFELSTKTGKSSGVQSIPHLLKTLSSM